MNLTPFCLVHRPIRAAASGARAAATWIPVLLGLSACESMPPTVFDRPERPAELLVLRTYEGSGQVVHPDVLHTEDPRWPFWLAITPYPDAYEKWENPCVYRSRDGIAWEEPAPLVNPVAPRPRFDHHCDPDWLREDHLFRLFWLDTQRREYRPDNRNFEDLKVVESPDGVTWGEPRTVIRWELDRDPFYVSPAVVRAGDGSHRVYVVQPRSATIPWMPIDPDAPDASDRPAPPPGGLLEYGLEGVRPWHVDVFSAPGGWVALLCARPPDATGPDDTDLWIGGSRDLDHWQFSAEPVLVGGDPDLGVEIVYRSSGLIENDRLVIWYSGRTAAGEWRLGVATQPASTVPFPD